MVFLASLLGPIAALLVVTLVIFLIAFCIIIGYSTKRFKGSKKASKRRGACRSIFSIFGVMLLFGLTWAFGALTIRGGSDYFKYLFVGFNSLQGVFVFVFFVVFTKETQDLWLQVCGCKERKKRKTLLSAITGVAPLKRDRLGLDENADRLKPMEEVDVEARLGMNSFDITFAVQPTQFDVLLNSDSPLRASGVDETQEEPALPMTREETDEQHRAGFGTAEQDSASRDHLLSQVQGSSSLDQKLDLELDTLNLYSVNVGHSPTHSLDSAHNAYECMSTTDSGILMSTTGSGILMSMTDSGILVDKGKHSPHPSLQHPQSGSTPRHVHSVSGIGYISAESSMETLPQKEEDCYRSKSEHITLAPSLSLRPRAVPNEYTPVNVENPC